MNIAQTINRCVYGMSDDQRDNEYEAQRRLYEAIGDFRAALEATNRDSVIAHVNLAAFDDFLHDEIMKISSWDEKISKARHG